jgi:thiamine-monophosphate kinase
MPRTGAHPGDVVAVTGTLGKAGAGYYALKRRRSEKKLIKALLEPVPKLKEGRLLAKQHSVTSSMDISDGLSASLYQLHEIHNLGFEINKNALPLASELSLLVEKNRDIDPYSLAMHFGGDYELLVTMSTETIEKAQKTLRRNGADLTVIGTVTKNKNVVLFDGKNKRIFENKGYEHFKKHYF